LKFIEDKVFKNENYLSSPLVKGEYDNCMFLNCSFSNADLSNINFTECSFTECDLSNSNVKNTVFNIVSFSKSKLIGLNFNDCSKLLFSVIFNDCNLSFASFYRQVAKHTKCSDSLLHQVDFTEADLSSSVFNNCDFKTAIFDNTILNKVNFRTSFNYEINPEINSIKKAKFSMPQVLGLLKKYNIDVE